MENKNGLNFSYGNTNSSIKSWNEFTNTTTFHGIRNIFNQQHSFLHRLCWTLIMFCVLGFFTFQIISRGVDFGRRESSISVEVDYTEKLAYPTVTICNQNRYL